MIHLHNDNVKTRTKEAKYLEEQFEIYALGLQLFSDNQIYRKRSSGRLLDRHYNFKINLPSSSSSFYVDYIALQIEEFKGKFEQAELDIRINNEHFKNTFKSTLKKYNIVSYNETGYGSVFFNIDEEIDLYNLIVELTAEPNK